MVSELPINNSSSYSRQEETHRLAGFLLILKHGPEHISCSNSAVAKFPGSFFCPDE